MQVDKPATFNINLNGALGTLKAVVKTPSGTEEDVFSQELDQDEYAMRFMPKENGVYYVYVRFNEAHIPGSPFPMLVGKLGADPALVFAKGDGLDKGEVGQLTCMSRFSSSFPVKMEKMNSPVICWFFENCTCISPAFRTVSIKILAEQLLKQIASGI